MKKIFRIAAGAVMSCILFSTTVCAQNDTVVIPSGSEAPYYSVMGDTESIPELVAESAIVVDMKTGYTLVEKNIYDKHYPASITKIMTAILVLEHASMEETVTFSDEAIYSVEVGSSAAYVDVGEELTIEQCLYGLLLISGNDLANGLAEHVGGSMDNFALMMTDKANTLGCLNTNFTNAHGLHDSNHYTTAYDMSLISKYAYDNLSEFRNICSTGYYECPPTNMEKEIMKWRNNNRLINEYEDHYYPDCIGGKTGYTDQAGGTLVTYANINGRTLMCVVMKSSNSAGAYTDTKNLYEYVRNNVNTAMYDSLDKKYEEILKAADARVDEQETTGVEEETEAETKTAKEPAKEDSEDGIWIGFKFFVLILTVFVIYYLYVRYMRYVNKKKRLERRRQNRGQ